MFVQKIFHSLPIYSFKEHLLFKINTRRIEKLRGQGAAAFSQKKSPAEPAVLFSEEDSTRKAAR
jgi:hypothetical protein